MSINPELIININRKPTVVKLYFKQDKLEKCAAEMIAVLLSMAFSTTYKDTFDYAVLDIRRGRLFRITETTPLNDIKVVLENEAKLWYNYQN